jgi:hypothetical protein
VIYFSVFTVINSFDTFNRMFFYFWSYSLAKIISKAWTLFYVHWYQLMLLEKPLCFIIVAYWLQGERSILSKIFNFHNTQNCKFQWNISWRGVVDTTLCDKVCQWLATGVSFSLGTPVSSTNKTNLHDIIPRKPLTDYWVKYCRTRYIW